MTHRIVPSLFAALLALTTFSSSAAPAAADATAKTAATSSTPLPNGLDILKDIDKVEPLPINGMVMVRNKRGQTVLVSDSGRYILTDARMIDTWNKGQIIDSPESLKYYGQRLDVANIPLPMLSTIEVGTGKRKLIAFVDPRCHFCHQLYEFVRTHKKDVDVTFVLLPILGPQSEALAKRMTCQVASKKKKDREIAADALLTGDYTHLTTNDKCDITPLKADLVAASVLGDHGVPLVIAADGRYVMGLPQPDLFGWYDKPSDPPPASVSAN